ncbi:MAG: sigma-54 dependent transcriptional regulator [Opitutales bacterium]|nr:sigma-54 dependent transcriptional regulator [Opitutales bacterium]
MLPCILVVDDEKNTRDTLIQLLEPNYEVFGACNYDEAVKLLKNERFDLVLSDFRLPGKNGLFVIDEARKRPYAPACIMMSAYGSVETAVEAVKHGAFDFVTKPINFDRLEVLIKRAILSKKPATATNDEKIQASGVPDIIGNSENIQNVLSLIKKVAPTKATVLLTGETGTGKEVFADALHAYSARAQKPFVAIHCAALPKNLLESELFGHEKGAFTGADVKHIGLFERASGGTVFLDEIGEIDLDIQVKLLRFLETRKISRIGSSAETPVDIRLVCATNRDLEQMVKKNEFREDLFYRINVINIPVPPLRDRTGDIPLLVNYYIEKFSTENGLARPFFSDEIMKFLQNYKWPGNVRELRNFCEGVVILHHGETITEKNLDRKFFHEDLLIDPQKR